jgi:hypothetical protein
MAGLKIVSITRMSSLKFWLSKEVLLTSLFALFIAVPLLVFGGQKTIYVDKDASGDQTGSSAHPYKSISKALKNADEGDVVCIKGGEYKENITIPKEVKVVSSKGDRDKVTIKADNGDQPTIVMKHGSELESVTVKGGRHGIRIAEDAKAHIYDVTVKGSSRDGIHIDAAKTDKKHRVIIDKTTVKGNVRAGIYSEKRDIVIVNSDIIENGSDGIDFAAGTEAWFEGSRFSNNKGSGMKLVIDGSSIWSKKNSIRYNGREGVEVNGYGAAGDVGFKKASFIGNGHYGISKVARTAAALKSFGTVSSGTGVNADRFEGNGFGTISRIIRGF